MEKNEGKSTAVFWALTIFCFVLFWMTYMVKNISIESITGASVFAGILFLYFCWFVYDTLLTGQNNDMMQAIKYNFKDNGAVWAMCCYWLVFAFFVVDALVLHINNG